MAGASLGTHCVNLPPGVLPGSGLGERTTSSRSCAVHFASPELCRAVPLRYVLGSFGGLLRSGPDGDDKGYSYSKVAGTIDVFLSHSWKSWWFRKTLAIMLHFNNGKAVVISNIAVACTFVGQCFALMPMYDYESSTMEVAANTWVECPGISTQNRHAQGMWCCVVGWASYTFFFFLAHHLQRMTCHESQVFLDKVCIQQCRNHEIPDEACPRCANKLSGINHLGAFLRESKKFVVLYDDLYFRRCWCCFEFACFLALNSVRNIEFLPLVRPGMVALLWVISVLLILARWVRDVLGMLETISFIGLIAACSFMVLWLLRSFAAERACTLGRLQHFRVQEAECSVESDKRMVLKSIAKWSRRSREESEDMDILSRIVSAGENFVEIRHTPVEVIRLMISAVMFGFPFADDSGEKQAALGLVEPGTSEEEALEAFNSFIRSEGYIAASKSLGSYSLPYRQLLPVMSSFAWGGLDYISSGVAVGQYNHVDILTEIMSVITKCFVLLPLALRAASCIVSNFPDLSFRGACALCASLTIVTTLVTVAGEWAVSEFSCFVRGRDRIDPDGVSRAQYIWVYIVFDLAGLLLLLYSGRRSSHQGGAADEQEEVVEYSNTSHPAAQDAGNTLRKALGPTATNEPGALPGMVHCTSETS